MDAPAPPIHVSRATWLINFLREGWQVPSIHRRYNLNLSGVKRSASILCTGFIYSQIEECSELRCYPRNVRM